MSSTATYRPLHSGPSYRWCQSCGHVRQSSFSGQRHWSWRCAWCGASFQQRLCHQQLPDSAPTPTSRPQCYINCCQIKQVSFGLHIETFRTVLKAISSKAVICLQNQPGRLLGLKALRILKHVIRLNSYVSDILTVMFIDIVQIT